MEKPRTHPRLPDWIDLQFILRMPWERFFKPRAAACRAATVHPRKPGVEHAVDAAVRSFARSGGWPALSEPEECLLGTRLHWAFCIVNAHVACAKPVFSLAAICEEEAVEWLLIDYWRVGGAPLFGVWS